MSRNYDNWERLVRAVLLREELRRLCREDSLPSLSSSSSSFSSSHTYNSSRSFRSPDPPLPPQHGIPSFSHRQIADATDYFSEQNLIFRGRYVDLFYGQLPDPVVIKRVRFENLEAFSSEVRFFSSLDLHSHPRFAPLLGLCSEKEREKFLVYRYLPLRDLTNSMYINTGGGGVDGFRSLDWITRWKIARGVAEGLAFLHHECDPPLVHGNLQTRSVLLDDGFEVRLGSLSCVSVVRLSPHRDKSIFMWRIKKASSGTTKACAHDVYCFGKVLIELVTGKLGISCISDAESKEFFEETLLNISAYYKELLTKIIDPSLIVEPDHFDEVWAVAIVAKACLNPEPNRRPVMNYVLRALEDPVGVTMEDTTRTGHTDVLFQQKH